MSWRNCTASMTLLAAVNQRWPRRDKRTDGTIGDKNHSPKSDHRPWVVVNGVGVVRARDIDRDGINAAALAEKLRKLGEAGDPRLAGGGYVIFNRRITSANFRAWHEYTGKNPHTSHVHVSFSRNRPGFDNPGGWWVDLFGTATGAASPQAARPPRPTGARPTIQEGSQRPRHVKDVQRRIKTLYPAFAAQLAVDGVFGQRTTAAVKEAQRRSGLVADGIVGQRTWKALGF